MFLFIAQFERTNLDWSFQLHKYPRPEPSGDFCLPLFQTTATNSACIRPSKPGSRFQNQREGANSHLCDTESPLPSCHPLSPSSETSPYRCRSRDSSTMAQSYWAWQAASPIPPGCWSSTFPPTPWSVGLQGLFSRKPQSSPLLWAVPICRKLRWTAGGLWMPFMGLLGGLTEIVKIARLLTLCQSHNKHSSHTVLFLLPHWKAHL